MGDMADFYADQNMPCIDIAEEIVKLVSDDDLYECVCKTEVPKDYEYADLVEGIKQTYMRTGTLTRKQKYALARFVEEMGISGYVLDITD